MKNTGKPFVSIVIPIIGYTSIPQYLMKSLLTLSYPKNRLEILFVKLTSQRIQLPSLGVKATRINSREIIGYSQAVNLGVRKGRGEFIFLINPDIRLDRNVLTKLIAYVCSHPAIGVVGPVVFQLKKPKKISPYDLPGIDFHKHYDRITPMAIQDIANLKNPYHVDWLSGCALLFSRRVWLKLGGFEEKLFIYWEDADFCMRAKEERLRVVLVPDARVWHEGSAYMSSQNLHKIYYIVRNGSYFVQRHSGLLGGVLFHANNLLMIAIKAARFSLQPSQRAEAYVYLLGIIDFYRGRWGRIVWEGRKKSLL